MTKWKLVPVEPTPEMIDAWNNDDSDEFSHAYRAMLEAAPQPPKLSDADINLIAYNIDEGDWNDLRFRNAWHEGFLRGFKEAKCELLGGEHE